MWAQGTAQCEMRGRSSQTCRLGRQPPSGAHLGGNRWVRGDRRAPEAGSSPGLRGSCAPTSPSMENGTDGLPTAAQPPGETDWLALLWLLGGRQQRWADVHRDRRDSFCSPCRSPSLPRSGLWRRGSSVSGDEARLLCAAFHANPTIRVSREQLFHNLSVS